MATVDIGILITATDNASRKLKKASTSVGLLGRTAKLVSTRLKTMGIALALVAVAMTLRLGKSIISIVGKFDALQVRLAALQGGFDKAREQFDLLFNKFKGAPFQLETIIDGFVRLRAAGLSTAKATDTISALVDAVAAFGGGSEEMKRATIGFQQVIGKAILTMEELRQQIGEAIPNAMAIMAAEAGESIAEFLTRVQRGMVSADEAIRLFTNGARKAFGGFADLLTNTLPGSIEAFNKTLNVGIANLFSQRTRGNIQFTAVIQEATLGVESFLDAMGQNEVDVVVHAFRGLLTVIQNIVNAFLFVIIVVEELDNSLESFATKHSKLFSALSLSLQSISGGVQFKFGDTADAIAKTKKELLELAKTGSFAERVSANYELRLLKLTGTLEELAATEKKVTDGREQLIEKVQLPTVDKGLNSSALRALQQLETISKQARAKMEGALIPFLGQMQTMNDQADDAIEKFDFIKDRLKDLELGFAIARGAGVTAKELSTVTDEIAQLRGSLLVAKPTVEDTDAAIAEFGVTMASVFAGDIHENIDKMVGKLNVMKAELGDSELGKAVAAIEQKFVGINLQLEEQIENAQILIDKGFDEEGTLQRAIALQGAYNTLKQDQIEKAKENIFLANRLLEIETQKLILAGQIRIEELKKETDTSILGNLSKGFPGADLIETAANMRNQLLRETLDLELKLETLGAQIRESDGERKRILTEQFEILDKQKETIEKVSASITAEGLALQEFWQGIGRTMSDALGSAIDGLIKGTATLRETTLKFFQDITAAAAKYIIKLLIIKALGAIFGPAGEVAGTAALSNFARGGVIPGGVKMFGKGGVVNGATAFGIAGEAGAEAILPLKRGAGGKLGVEASGGGGNTLIIQAIDTQTGIDFIMKNRDTISMALNGLHRMNRGMLKQVA